MAQNQRSSNSNQLLVPGVAQALEQMKIEIAQEFGVQLGAETTSRANGSVGGEITKRLVRQAQQQLSGQFPQQQYLIITASAELPLKTSSRGKYCQ